MTEGSHPFKFVFVGDNLSGKTSLLFTFLNGKFPKDYVPTIFDNFVCSTEINGTSYHYTTWDTLGDADGFRAYLRTLSYYGTDVVMLCFSIEDRYSFENIKKWHSHITKYIINPEILLIGTKSDLRKSVPQGPMRFQR